MWCEALTGGGCARGLRSVFHLLALVAVLLQGIGAGAYAKTIDARLQTVPTSQITDDLRLGLALGLRVVRPQLLQPRPPVTSSDLTAVEPIYDLPTQTYYDGADNLIKITAGSEMDRAYDPPTPVSPNILGDLGSRTNNQTEMQLRYDGLAASDASATLQLQAGIDYGQLILKARPSGSAAGTIYIVSSARASLPTPSHSRLTGDSTHRVRPSDAPFMFILSTAATSGNTIRAIRIADSTPNVSRVWIDGAEIRPTSGSFSVSTFINLSPQTGSADPANYASYINLGRSYVHGVTTNGNSPGVGIQFGVAYGKIHDCCFEKCAKDGEGKCILVVTNPGPHAVQNCFLEASGMSVMIGGGDPPIAGHVPADGFWDGIHSFRPYGWNNHHPAYDASYTGVFNKNGLEMKFGDRFVWQRIIVENVWSGGQDGDLVTFKLANQSGGVPGNHVYLRNITFCLFYLFNGNGGWDLTGVTQAGSYADQQFSRPQRMDIHEGMIALGNALDYAPSKGAHHAQLIIGDDVKDIRYKRISGAAPDSLHGAVQFTPGNIGGENITMEDCTWQAGVVTGGGTLQAYDEGGSLSPPSPDEGDNQINTAVINPVWQRVGIYQPHGNFTATRQTQLDGQAVPKHVVLNSTAASAVYENADFTDLWNADWTIKHPSLTTAGEGGTVAGPNAARIKQLLLAVKN